jgi:hypothetical protein
MANIRCDVCGDEIQHRKDGGTFCEGWWKSADAEEPDFDPSGNEYDMCFTCANRVTTFIQGMIRS